MVMIFLIYLFPYRKCVKRSIYKYYPPAIFNNMPFVRSVCQKHLEIYLDEKFNFSNQIK